MKGRKSRRGTPLPVAVAEADLTSMSIMVHHDGMQTMGYRTTFAFDNDTMRRLRNLAARWQVSQAEVVRRALSQAETLECSDAPNPLDALKSYHAHGGLDRGKAEKYLCEVRESRESWRS
jgi:hypothetical protein